MKTLKLIPLFFIFSATIFYGQNPNRKFKEIKKFENHVEVITNDGLYRFQSYKDEIIETSFIPRGNEYISSSHAVVLKPEEVKPEILETQGITEIKMNGVSVKIQHVPFKISYYYKDSFLISEKAGYVKNDSLETLQFNLKKDEVLYGGGARALGMNRRGHRLQLYNRAHYGYETHSELMNYTMPIVLSSSKYMMHFDNAPIGFLDLDSKEDNTLTYETISGRKTYQIIVGDSWYDVLENYTDLTGKQPMLPRWALGNFSSRFGYHSQAETEATIEKFREEEIPVDAIILDLYWFGKEMKGTMGNLEFYKDSFPDPVQMIKNLRAKNVETILITEPFVLSTSKRWDEAVKEDVLAKDTLGNPFTFDFYFGNTGLVDIYNPQGNRWFKDVYKRLAKMGVTGFWGDLGEPEVHPEGLIHAAGTANQMHNIYGHDWASLVYEANREFNPNQRPFTLMRAGYSGSQRYAMVPWSGDVNRTWGGLQSQPEIALQMGMQGLAYMHSDLGGFAGANLDDELYVRWLQYGVFQPVYRPHAQEDVPSEPVFRSENAKALAKAAIELRYRLLPYNYNLVFENNQEGKPLMRPLLFEEPDNPELMNYSKTYLWGNDILVSPVLTKGAKQQEVYFPKGAKWFNFYTNNIIEGGQTKMLELRENHIPTFIRGGAFIPMAKAMQSTKEYNGEALELHYYFVSSEEEFESEFYNDDGKTAQAYEKGNYEILEFEAELEKRCLEVEFEAEIGSDFEPVTKHIDLVIHNIQNQPKRIKVDKKKVDVDWNDKTKCLTIPVAWHPSNELEIKIKLNKK
ncbi:TIM-barrel domain-containing protein [Seonamhaeicola marinus]|uniref:DUF5110 domain-containing protein n=1 Tax=Seonamhaeicola marinus TaxID=1912246 RepID=A0A5D0HF68_9FLAO|nr:TIM-barrel domain-containing protein [Seonamhaeicola marinus]TYA69921.1 DUF5110 domain-containing protein [Seonamhaeicola marinus]